MFLHVIRNVSLSKKSVVLSDESGSPILTISAGMDFDVLPIWRSFSWTFAKSSAFRK